MKLKQYNDKRDFSSTLEPKGKVANSSKLPIFVVQYHKARANHYDFRLEWKGVLLSWAVPKGLSYNPQEKRLAVQVEDHPLDYANFHGIIPKGNYGAGSVEIYDSGVYQPSYDIDKGLKKGHLKFILHGQKFVGEWSLVKIDEKNWLIIKSQDEFAKKDRKLKAALPFTSCQPMLALLTDKIPEKGYIFEIKYDGYRLLSFIQNGKVKCQTRNGQNYTDKFPTVAKSLSQIDEKSFVADGEVVCFDENGRSSFSLLQEDIKAGGYNCVYVIFDLLALNGEDLRAYPLMKRKELLNRLFSREREGLIYSEFVENNGKRAFEFAKENNLEGIVAKKMDSPYSSSRNGDWLKIKCYLRQEFVICGYTTTDKNQILSALVLGYYENGALKFVGKVGTGFDEDERLNLNKELSKLVIKTKPEGFPKIDAIWVMPKLVAEIQFAELTADKILRQPSFMGLRRDKKACDVVLEEKK